MYIIHNCNHCQIVNICNYKTIEEYIRNIKYIINNMLHKSGGSQRVLSDIICSDFFLYITNPFFSLLLPIQFQLIVTTFRNH